MYYLLIEPSRKPAFDRAVKKQSGFITLEEYGRVIASCYGAKPTEDVRRLLKEKYDFDV